MKAKFNLLVLLCYVVAIGGLLFLSGCKKEDTTSPPPPDPCSLPSAAAPKIDIRSSLEDNTYIGKTGDNITFNIEVDAACGLNLISVFEKRASDEFPKKIEDIDGEGKKILNREFTYQLTGYQDTISVICTATDMNGKDNTDIFTVIIKAPPTAPEVTVISQYPNNIFKGLISEGPATFDIEVSATEGLKELVITKTVDNTETVLDIVEGNGKESLIHPLSYELHVAEAGKKVVITALATDMENLTDEATMTIDAELPDAPTLTVEGPSGNPYIGFIDETMVFPVTANAPGGLASIKIIEANDPGNPLQEAFPSEGTTDYVKNFEVNINKELFGQTLTIIAIATDIYGQVTYVVHTDVLVLNSIPSSPFEVSLSPYLNDPASESFYSSNLNKSASKGAIDLNLSGSKNFDFGFDMNLSTKILFSPADQNVWNGFDARNNLSLFKITDQVNQSFFTEIINSPEASREAAKYIYDAYHNTDTEGVGTLSNLTNGDIIVFKTDPGKDSGYRYGVILINFTGNNPDDTSAILTIRTIEE